MIEGTFQLTHSDDFRASEARFYPTLLAGGRRLRLERPGRGAALRSGDRIRVVGSAHGDRLRVQRLTRLARPAARTLAAAPAQRRRVAVLLVNFADDPSTPYTPSAAAATMFGGTGSVASYFDEISFGATTIAGDVYGWYTLPSSSAGCTVDRWANEAEAAATAAGVSLAGYHHVVYAFPRASSCGWAGLAEMPGRKAWINGSFTLKVVAHELTHNLGTHHAGALTCSSGGARVPLEHVVLRQRVRRSLRRHGQRLAAHVRLAQGAARLARPLLDGHRGRLGHVHPGAAGVVLAAASSPFASNAGRAASTSTWSSVSRTGASTTSQPPIPPSTA